MRNFSLIIGYIQKANGLNAEWCSSPLRSLSDHTLRVSLCTAHVLLDTQWGKFLFLNLLLL